MAGTIPKSLRLDVNNLMADTLGGGYGVDAGAVERWRPRAEAALKAVQSSRGQGWLGWMDLPAQPESLLDDIEAMAERIRLNYDAFVLLGIGGSALGPICVNEALRPPRYNELPKARRGGPRMYFEDNIDPERMASLRAVVDFRDACFNVITKSGGTAETMSQYLYVRDALRDNPRWRDQVVATTSGVKGLLLDIARLEGLKTFVIPEGVGGRFSELCPVGLLAAAVGGADIRALLKGAADMDARCATPELWKNPALLEAALMAVASVEMGRNIQVMMPYADSLRMVSNWFVQLWAESLGKLVNRAGAVVNAGQTPVGALGVTDQHSQLQLYSEGPFDKVITMMKVETFREETAIPRAPEDYPGDIRFLGGLTHSQLIEAERFGTEYALTRAKRMNQTIILPEVSEYTLGQLLYFFEMVTAYMGELLDVDAFNQPGVEASKIATYAKLGHPAERYAEARSALAAAPERDARYII
ncbi:MAG: glucose-6-phosphate isomerase [Oscillospiraceae bacterium]|jgi:glucose-6-phosphate isomerase|nr:glucose-6-phosphate isomerase [Oscillospiraceae bacterium]